MIKDLPHLSYDFKLVSQIPVYLRNELLDEYKMEIVPRKHTDAIYDPFKYL